MSSPSLTASMSKASVHCGLCGSNLTSLNEDERLNHFRGDYCLGHTRGSRMIGFLVLMTSLMGAAAVTMTLFYRG